MEGLDLGVEAKFQTNRATEDAVWNEAFEFKVSYHDLLFGACIVSDSTFFLKLNCPSVGRIRG